MQAFDITLERPDDPGSWTYFNAPFNVEQVFGTKAQVKVCGTYSFQGKSVEYRSSLMPVGDGRHYIVVNKQLREVIGADFGDTIHVTMEKDTAERSVTVPEELVALLAENASATTLWEKLSYSHQKEYVDWINEAKTDTTRQKRVQGTIERLLEGKRLK